MNHKKRLKLIKKLYKQWKRDKEHQEWIETSYRYDDRRNFVPLLRPEK